jgi:hypothetical protein
MEMPQAGRAASEPAFTWAVDDPRSLFLAALFQLTGSTGIRLSPFDVFYVSGLGRRGHGPVAIARELAAYGYVDYMAGTMRLTEHGRRCSHRLASEESRGGSMA